MWLSSFFPQYLCFLMWFDSCFSIFQRIFVNFHPSNFHRILDWLIKFQVHFRLRTCVGEDCGIWFLRFGLPLKIVSHFWGCRDCQVSCKLFQNLWPNNSWVKSRHVQVSSGPVFMSIWLLRCGYCRSTCKGKAIHLGFTECDLYPWRRFDAILATPRPSKTVDKLKKQLEMLGLKFWSTITDLWWIVDSFFGLWPPFFSNKTGGNMYLLYATILILKDFDIPIESYRLMVYQMWCQGSWKKNLDPNWMVKSFFQWSRARLPSICFTMLNCYHH